MLTEEHDDGDGRRVWLDESEVDELHSLATEQKHRIAMALGALGRLRSHEIVQVTPDHVVSTDAGVMLTIPEGMGEKYRETPIPETLDSSIRTIGVYRDEPNDEPVIPNPARTLRYWIQNSRETMALESHDDRWHFLTSHDLRRTLAGQLANADVDEMVALRWGGWNGIDGFPCPDR